MSKYGESGFDRVDELNLKIIDELGEVCIVNVVIVYMNLKQEMILKFIGFISQLKSGMTMKQ